MEKPRKQINDLPSEILLEICLYLPFFDRFHLIYINKIFKYILEDSKVFFWKKSFQQIKILHRNTKNCTKRRGEKNFIFWKKKVYNYLVTPKFVPFEGINISNNGLRVDLLNIQKTKNSKSCWKTITTDKRFINGKHLIMLKGNSKDKNKKKKFGKFQFIVGLTPELDLNATNKENDISVLGISVNFYTLQDEWKVGLSFQYLFDPKRKEPQQKHVERYVDFIKYGDKRKMLKEDLLEKFISVYFDIDNKHIIFLVDNEEVLEMKNFYDDTGNLSSRSHCFTKDYKTTQPKEFYFSLSIVKSSIDIEIVRYKRFMFKGDFIKNRFLKYLSNVRNEINTTE